MPAYRLQAIINPETSTLQTRNNPFLTPRSTLLIGSTGAKGNFVRPASNSIRSELSWCFACAHAVTAYSLHLDGVLARFVPIKKTNDGQDGKS